MYAVEAFAAHYYEERAAAEAAQKLAEQQEAAALQAREKSPVAAQQSTPSSLQHALYRPQTPLTQPGSTTVLGSIFQNFMKRAPNSPGISPAQTPSRVDTPTGSEDSKKKDMAALIAKLKEEDAKRRDLEICAFPGWR